MPKIYKSAQGRVVDMEKLRLASEETIAVGNMRVNARGDQIGNGGKVVKTRNQLMREYYDLNSPVSKPSLEADMNYQSKTDVYSTLGSTPNKNTIVKNEIGITEKTSLKQKNQKQKSNTVDEDAGDGV